LALKRLIFIGYADILIASPMTRKQEEPRRAAMGLQPWSSFGWVIAASLVGFAISAVFAGWIKLSVNRFIIPYVFIVGVFLYGFVVLNEIDVAALIAKNWVWGVAETTIQLLPHYQVGLKLG
jgi:hypothetical protein